MSPNVRAVVRPGSLRALSVVAMITTGLLGGTWVVAALFSVDTAAAHIAYPTHTEDLSPLLVAPFALALWAGFMISGGIWAAWQRYVALVAAAGQGVRDPGWHAMAWFSPVVMWWEPLRNMRELSAYLLPPGRRWLVPAWWVSWVLFRLLAWLVLWQLWMFPPLLLPPVAVGVAAVIVTVPSTILAAVLIQLLTSSALARVRVPYAVDYATRPYPYARGLFIVGAGIRLLTPVIVIWLLAVFAKQLP